MNDFNNLLLGDCEEMLMEEYDHNQTVIINNSEDDTDMDSEYDTSSQYSNNDTTVEFDSVVEDIFDDEEIFLDSEYEDGEYFIGLPCLMRSQTREWVLQVAITPKSLFRYDYKSVMRYLTEYSVTRIYNPVTHIMKLDISNTGSYNVVLKTFWLKIIQRSWKRVYRNRQLFVLDCKNPNSLLYRQVNGKWRNDKRYPGLRGMLAL
jgi:hypothetical protein